MNSAVQVGTIREVQQRLADEGFRISCYAIRRWVKSGTIPAVYTGKKALISYSSVRDLLLPG